MIALNAKFMFLFARDVSQNLGKRAHKTINMKYPRSILCVVIVWPNIE